MLCVCFVETPLTFAAHLYNVEQVIVVLKQGGAHLDFRSQDGMTALHHAVRAKNQATLKVIQYLYVFYSFYKVGHNSPLYLFPLALPFDVCRSVWLKQYSGTSTTTAFL